MNGKAKFIAISGLCAALAAVATFLCSLPALNWCVPIFAVAASVAVAIPLLIDGRNLAYSLLVYAVSVVVSALGGVFLSNVVYVAPVVLFCMPFAIVKVYGETYKFTRKAEHAETLEDPFGQGDDRKVISVEFNGKKRLPTVVKWIIYYALLEVGIALTLLVTYLLTPAVFDAMYYSNALVFWLIVVIAQLAVPLYDLLLQGCLLGTDKLLKKIVK